VLIHGLPVDQIPAPRPITGWGHALVDALERVFTVDELAALAVGAAGAPAMVAGRGALVAQGIVADPDGPWPRLVNALAVAAHTAADRVT
jgi:hypothetical protein